MFSLKARNVFKKARSLFSFPAEEDEGEGKKPSDGLYGSVQTLGLNRAVVGAESCGRWGRIVRSLRPDRAVDFFALTGQCEGIVRLLAGAGKSCRAGSFCSCLFGKTRMLLLHIRRSMESEVSLHFVIRERIVTFMP